MMTEQIKIRPFEQKDIPFLIAVLRKNTPLYFDPSEEPDYREYHAHETERYFVMEYGNAIIGAGGYNTGFENGSQVRISWDLIDPDFQGRGFGKILLEHRISEISKIQGVQTTVVRTSQKTYLFYEKTGFKLYRIVPDYWSKNFDLYELHLNISSGPQ
ncbi:MAG: GNAT family N-acetyltransferase [Brumimicrobium sp.]|nr:GNAT family N-acetyltransferase [Brumimicrobium sp.]